MKRVLLVTLYDGGNIGNRLQNYALQKVIENYGIEVTTLDNLYTRAIPVKIRIKYFAKKVLVCLGYKKYANECVRYSAAKRRKKAIKQFNQTNISIVRQTTNLDAFRIDWSDYDLAIAGSDQVWHNWRDDVNELPYYYLQFMPSEKRVAYAASFGFETFPQKDIEQHRIGLQGMKSISCREESGCKLVESLVDKQVPRVLDPTLLLSADEWRKLQKQSNIFTENYGNYAFAFFLGNIPDEYRKYMDTIMKEKGIDKLIDFSDKKIGACGPCEFLSLIDNAQFVFTDSFHCTVFSTIFDKDFTAFRRVQQGFDKMFGRIEDLLSSTNKLDHIYGGTRQTPKNNFNELYRDSIRYIEKILGITNEN